MALLDTDFLIDVMRGRAAAVELLGHLLDSSDPLTTSAITIMQLHHGVARARLPQHEAERVGRALQGVATHALTHEIAAHAGRMDGELVRRGRRTDPADVIIAATAVHHNEPVVTRNAGDFDRFEGVRLVTY